MLARAGVEFIVVGMVAAIIHGVPMGTYDMDIVHRRTPGNIEKLKAALAELEARFRIRNDLAPNESHLSGPGHVLLVTKFGRLDVLGAIGVDQDYDRLVEHSELVYMGGVNVRAINLPTLIRLNEQAGREKDIAVLPHLRRTLAERNKRGLDK